jgi:hypothetical protein
MRIGTLLCAVIGHKWHTVASETEIEAVLECRRCGRHTLAPNADSISIRTKVKADAYGSFLKK